MWNLRGKWKPIAAGAVATLTAASLVRPLPAQEPPTPGSGTDNDTTTSAPLVPGQSFSEASAGTSPPPDPDRTTGQFHVAANTRTSRWAPDASPEELEPMSKREAYFLSQGRDPANPKAPAPGEPKIVMLYGGDRGEAEARSTAGMFESQERKIPALVRPAAADVGLAPDEVLAYVGGGKLGPFGKSRDNEHLMGHTLGEAYKVRVLGEDSHLLRTSERTGAPTTGERTASLNPGNE